MNQRRIKNGHRQFTRFDHQRYFRATENNSSGSLADEFIADGKVSGLGFRRHDALAQFFIDGPVNEDAVCFVGDDGLDAQRG